MRVIGTINKRIDVGYDRTSKCLYIMAASNCILFTDNEMDCLMSVLSILHTIALDDAVEWFHKHRIKLWEPAPPPAEVIII